jgi:hypothetical protein
MLKLKNWTLGSDFELPLYDHNEQRVISVEGLLGGTKISPLSIGEGCYRQEDGTSGEFNIPPVTTKEDFISSVNYCIEVGNAIVQENNVDLEFVAMSSADYSNGELATQQCSEFGCSESFNAYTFEANSKPNPNVNYRTSGLHLHVGVPEKWLEKDQVKFIKYMDLFLGLPSMLIDLDDRRRELYGKAGEYRRDKRGKYSCVEYRVLGSGLLSDPLLLSWVYDQTIAAINAYNENTINIDEIPLEGIINNNNKEHAFQVCDSYGIQFPIDADGKFVSTSDSHLIFSKKLNLW